MNRYMESEGFATISPWQNLPEDILRLIFRWLYPATDPLKMSAGILDQIAKFSSLASVCRHWRRVSFPILHSTAVILIDVTYAVAPITRTPVNSAGMASETAVIVRTNADLVLKLGFEDCARELLVCIAGASLSPGALLRALNTAGLSRTVWMGISRLSFGTLNPAGFAHEDIMRGEDYGVKATLRLNKNLSLALPALREITYFDLFCRTVYNRFPLNPLVNERVSGSTKLCALRFYVDIPPALGNYQGQPIEVPVVHISGINLMRPVRVPAMVASALVELTLTSVPQALIWQSFVMPFGASGGNLEFSCLRSLTLMFFWRYSFGAPPRNMMFDDASSDDNRDNGSTTGDSVFLRDDEQEMAMGDGYMVSSVYGRPRFPALEKLDVHRFSGDTQQFLSLFAASPLKSLVVAGLQSEIPEDINFADFASLENLDIRYIGMEGSAVGSQYVARSVMQISTTAPTNLKRLSLGMAIAGSTIPFPLPQSNVMDFAHQLRSLRISSSVDLQATMLPLLAGLPNLESLSLESIVVAPIRSIALLIQELRDAPRILPVNESVRRLALGVKEGAEGMRHCQAVFGSALDVTVSDGLFRGVLLELLCRLPAADMVRVHGASGDAGLQKATKMLVLAGIVGKRSEELGHLREMKFLPWDAQK
ncbi:hypothetical protein LPJ66_007383 [Kickxella alabastrina]|uniref:Uncharacterized protein n=1 Tax=Kickxella alabastrina TaxID=61397 RepID=A0ACC1IHC0_9FUNG|nr:hypothetical protein LPJ66_007383 [Kickxella alabastrina]